MLLVPNRLLTQFPFFPALTHILYSQAVPALLAALAEKRLNRVKIHDLVRLVLSQKELEMTPKDVENQKARSVVANEVLEIMTKIEREYAEVMASQKDTSILRLKLMRRELLVAQGMKYLAAALGECLGSGAY